MSHTTVVRSIPIRNRETLDQVLKNLGLPASRYLEKYPMYDGRTCTGISISLPGWHKPVIFDLENGQAYFDNYSPYNDNHYLVKSGQKRVGDDGHWGNINELYKVINNYLAEELTQQAAAYGQTVEQTVSADGTIQVVVEVG